MMAASEPMLVVMLSVSAMVVLDVDFDGTTISQPGRGLAL